MDTVHWSKMLENAFEKDQVGALNKVIGQLRVNLDAHPGSPAAADLQPAVPSPPVHDVPAPALGANSAPAVHPARDFRQVLFGDAYFGLFVF